MARKKDLISMFRDALVYRFLNILVYFNKLAKKKFKPLDRFFTKFKILEINLPFI